MAFTEWSKKGPTKVELQMLSFENEKECVAEITPKLTTKDVMMAFQTYQHFCEQQNVFKKGLRTHCCKHVSFLWELWVIVSESFDYIV